MRRWLLWTFYCRRGVRCADLVLSAACPDIPAGVVANITYECGGCGSRYSRSVLFGEDGSFTQADRELVAR